MIKSSVMKRLSSSLGLLLLLTAYLPGRAQSAMGNFFHQPGVADLAQMAHPLNTFASGSYTVYDDYVIVDIVYQDDNSLKLQVDRGGLWGFKRIRVLYDSDDSPAFGGLWLLMSLAQEEAKKDPNYNKVVNYLSLFNGKQVDDWSGHDWALCLLVLDYNSQN
jgi:hypothetical protein